MPLTPVMQQTMLALQNMDKQLMEAESHLRVLSDADHPGAVKLAADIATARRQRDVWMQAIQKEANRPDSVG